MKTSYLLFLTIWLFGTSGFTQRVYHYIHFSVAEEIHCHGVQLTSEIDTSMDQATAMFMEALSKGLSQQGIHYGSSSIDSVHDSSILILKVARRKTQATYIRRFNLGIFPLAPVCHIFEIEQINRIPPSGDVLWTRVKIIQDKFLKGLQQFNAKLAADISKCVYIVDQQTSNDREGP